MLGWLVVLSCATRPGSTDERTTMSAGPTSVGAVTSTKLQPRTVATSTGRRELTTPALDSRPSRAPDAPQPFLVWTEHEEAALTTWVASRGDDYQVLDQRPGRWMAVDDAEWRLDVQTTRFELPGCDELLDHPGLAGKRFATVQQLRAHSDSTERLLYGSTSEAAPTDGSIRELFVIGPYLLAETQEYTATCGAFATESRTVRAWKLGDWEPVNLDYARRSTHAELLLDAESAIGDECAALTHLGVGAFRPHLDGPTLLGEYAVTITPSCDSFPEWTHDSSHVLLRSPVLPPELVAHAVIPAPVRDYIADSPAQTPRGWTLPLSRRSAIAHRGGQRPPHS